MVNSPEEHARKRPPLTVLAITSLHLMVVKALLYRTSVSVSANKKTVNAVLELLSSRLEPRYPRRTAVPGPRDPGRVARPGTGGPAALAAPGGAASLVLSRLRRSR